MIFDAISLYNFGLYRGFQRIVLTPPSRNKPVLLFGGLNGGGKTTLLDAIQLALYGKLARCSNRGTLSYGDFLRRCIHMGAHNPSNEASIILEFRHPTDGENVSYRIQRSWNGSGKNVSESVVVVRNGISDSVLAEQWLDFIESVLPNTIAHLFFFDGEKIEALADPTRSAELLRSAIHSLLGLDLVDRLCNDLLAMERRQRGDALDTVHKAQADALTTEIETLERMNEVTKGEQARLRGQLDKLEKTLLGVEQTFRQQGGDLFEQRQMLEAESAAAKATLSQAKKELIQVAGQADTPLLMLPDLVAALTAQHRSEHEQRENYLLVSVLEKRDIWLLERLRGLVDSSVAAVMSALMEEERQRRMQAAPVPSVAQLSDEAAGLLSGLVPPQASEARIRLNDRLEVLQHHRMESEQRERRLAAVPESDAIQHIIEERQRLKDEIQHLTTSWTALGAELQERQRTIDRIGAERGRLLEAVAREEIKRLEAQRLLEHSQRSRETLKRFRDRVLHHNVERIASLILTSFKTLLRKDHFVQQLHINPQTCELTLLGTQGCIVEATRLSAGERQILATSMLWGLARASGRDLPIVIDTPLGRLDSKHRTKLVDRYFPQASAQVILLSTDEEIDARYYRRLAPNIGWSYILDYNDAEGYTLAKPGYFWQEELAS